MNHPDLNAAAHSHSMYGKTFSTMGRLLEPITQDSCAFYENHVLFDDFTRVVLDTSEGDRIAEALGDKKGITRFANSYVTFDETLTRTAMDLCNRPYFIWNVKTTLDKVGDMEQELFPEFFKSLITEARMNCHIETLYGDNNHHIIESCFKSFALSLKKAVTIDPRKKNIPSSKGKL